MPGIYPMREAAGAVGLSLRTVRYYRKAGLVVPSARVAVRHYDEFGIDPGSEGWLLYTDETLERLRLLKPMKPLRFSLEEMKDCLRLRNRLAAGVMNAAQLERVVERLEGYVRKAGGRVQQGRQQLDMADEFSGQIRRLVNRFGGDGSRPHSI